MTATTYVPSESLAERFAASTPAARKRALGLLTVEQQRDIATGHPWWFYGRSDQQPPPGADWRWWLVNAGRGFGKTRTGGEWSTDRARRYPNSRCALIAPTYADFRDTMVEGESGILSFTDFTQLRGGSLRSGWNRSIGELYFANGSRFRGFASAEPWRLRGPQHHTVWGDEPAYWKDAPAGVIKDTTFFNANVGLRLPARPGWPEDYRPAGCLTTTPRFVPLLKVPAAVLQQHPEAAGLMQRRDVATTTGTTMANLHNLDRSYYDAVVAPLLGTAIGVQELGGVLLEEVEGALWRMAQIEQDRQEAPPITDRTKTVVAYDPSGSALGDEHGIIVATAAGVAERMHTFILADYSGSYEPAVAAQHAIVAAWEHSASAIVYEKNQGQRWIPTVFDQVWEVLRADPEWAKVFGNWRMPPLEAVDAVRDKATRARPAVNLSQQHRLHHVRVLPLLEAELTTWVPDESDSPNRLDALVWAVLWLYGMAKSQGATASPGRRERGGRRPDQPSSRLPSVYGTRTRRG